MAKPHSIYISESTWGLVRGKEPLSARINQIAERYQLMIGGQLQAVREAVGQANISAMARQWKQFERRDPVIGPTLLVAELAAGISPELGKTVDELGITAMMALLELVEAEVIVGAPARAAGS